MTNTPAAALELEEKQGDNASTDLGPGSNRTAQAIQSASKAIPCVAYYLGQFHRINLNDKHWGSGFTEWHNVARARPLYPGHVQPKLPGTLGFYDLRNPATLHDQIAYAHQVGVSAFCYWHFWFGGQRVLHQPLDDMIRLQYPGFRFILGWANESWTGIWHGASNKILVEQSYNAQELESHARLIAGYIESGHYLSVDGRFPMVIYRPKKIPQGAKYLAELKSLVLRYAGSELYLVGNWYQGGSHGFIRPADLGLDAAVITPIAPSFSNHAMRKLYNGVWHTLRKAHIGPEVRPYRSLESAQRKAIASIDGVAHATIVSGWDNTPRSGRRGLVLSGYDRQSFRRVAADAVALERQQPMPLLFLKSWNEWAEGNTVEPLFQESWSAGQVLREVLRGS